MIARQATIWLVAMVLFPLLPIGGVALIGSWSGQPPTWYIWWSSELPLFVLQLAAAIFFRCSYLIDAKKDQSSLVAMMQLLAGLIGLAGFGVFVIWCHDTYRHDTEPHFKWMCIKTLAVGASITFVFHIILFFSQKTPKKQKVV